MRDRFAERLVRLVAVGLVLSLGPSIGAGPPCPVDDTWDNGILDDGVPGGPIGRRDHTAVWTGAEMIVWGGRNSANALVNTGERYDPLLDTWAPVTTVGAPPAMAGHIAVWTGTEMIVWGGAGTGGIYDPANDSWSPMSTTGQPALSYRLAVWDGDEMIVWGTNGPLGSLTGGGGRYDPLADTWSPISMFDAPEPRQGASVVWTGTEMIIMGGYSDNDVADITGTGARYDPALDEWTPIPWGGGRRWHSAVWTGEAMIVWGGNAGPFELNTGAIYDPAGDSWTPTSTAIPLPIPDDRRMLHTAVWTGAEMVIWGGSMQSTFLNSVLRYDPRTDTWAAGSATGAPAARSGHTAVWTGDYMIVWGGQNAALGTGGRFVVDIDHDGICNALDECPLDPLNDADTDGYCANDDNCPIEANHSQADLDADDVGDVCDVCPTIADSSQADLDEDDVGDACDACTDPDEDGWGSPGFPATECGIDNCPDDANPGQADEDADAIGDPCDDCPADPINDPDDDALCATADNCPLHTNPTQFDADADGTGDPCDTCTDTDGDGSADAGFPASTCGFDNCRDAANPVQLDTDGDAIGDACDRCPLVADPEQEILDSRIKLSQDTALDDDVLSFRIVPGGTSVAYVWEPASGSGDRVYRTGIDGGPKVALSPSVSFCDITAMEVSPDGPRVVYLADQTTSNVFELYSVPVVGGLATKLNGALASGGDVQSFTIGPDGETVFFIANGTAAGVNELYSVPVAGGTAVKLNGTLPAGGDVDAYGVTADGVLVVYRADQDVDNLVELYSVPAAGGSAVKLNGTLPTGGDVDAFAISPDGATVVFRADQNANDAFELFSVPATGGPTVQLNAPLVNPARDVHEFAIAPDGSEVVYRANNSPTTTAYEAYVVPIGGGSSVRPHGPLSGALLAFAVSPDGETLVLRAQGALHAVALDGGPTVQLTSTLFGNQFFDFAISPASDSLVYRRDEEAGFEPEIYHVSLTSGLVTKLNGPLANSGEVAEYRFDPAGQRVFYRADSDVSGQLDLYTVRPAVSTSFMLNDGNLEVVTSFAIAPDPDRLVYLMYNNSVNRYELWRADLEPDGDADGVLDSCDCAPGDPGVFTMPPEVSRLDFAEPTSLHWAPAAPDAGSATTYDVLRGATAELPVGSGAEVCLESDLPLPACGDTDDPDPGEAFYYLVRAVNACGVGTWGFDSSDNERMSGECTP